jgi:farnesyl-diphosphate farnesyltransferase
MVPDSSGLLRGLLKNVSRSFYLTLRALPGEIRAQIGLAYLLARATDTIADTEIIPIAQRLEALQALRERILGTTEKPLDFAAWAEHQASPAERILLEHCEEALALLRRFTTADQLRIRKVIDIITSGQELDLKRFAGATANQIKALQSDEELDDYTYRVAGCVGEFWTEMCRAHSFPECALDERVLFRNAVRFGKGLQLVNILRDLPCDLRQGRCYLPIKRLSTDLLVPSDLLNPENELRCRAVYDHYLEEASAHLAAGWEYTNALPRSCFRLRFACALPLLIGIQTIKKLRTQNILNHQVRIKVDRQEVRKLVVRLLVYYPFPSAWGRLFVRT